MTRAALIKAAKEWAEIAVIAALAYWCAMTFWDVQQRYEAQREAEWRAKQMGQWLEGLKGE